MIIATTAISMFINYYLKICIQSSQDDVSLCLVNLSSNLLHFRKQSRQHTFFFIIQFKSQLHLGKDAAFAAHLYVC